MQPQQLSSLTAPIVAFCLSLLLSITLAPTLGLSAYQQYDFWILWAVVMLLVAFPFTLLEIGLARRTKKAPLEAFMQLTREADRSTRWRLISWGAVLFVPFVAGAILNFSAVQIQNTFNLDLQNSVLILIFALLACASSLLPRLILLFISIIASIAVIGTGLVQSGTASAWQWTGIELVEWSKVITLSLVVTGLGLGIYWQSAIRSAQSQQSTLPVALPIWLAQALGLGSLMLVNGIQSTVQACMFLIAAFGLSGVLLQYVREQAIERKLPLVMQAVVLLVPLLLWAIPASATWFYVLVIAYGLMLCFTHAIFTGWMMKISHLRKSLNLPNEATYNIWRVFIRIIVPLSILIAMLGWIQMLVAGA